MIAVLAVSLILFGFGRPVRASDKPGSLENTRSDKSMDVINTSNVSGKYFCPDNRGNLELSADESFTLKTADLKTHGKFKMDGMGEIIFDTWGGKTGRGSFEGNVLTGPDISKWYKMIENKDVAGTYYDSSDYHNYIEFNKDGTLTGLFESKIKVTGTYTVSLFDITLTVKDPEGKEPDEELTVEMGCIIPGRAQDILTDDGAGVDFIKKNESVQTLEKYIQINSHDNDYVELKADGTFYWQIEGTLSSGLYLKNNDSLHLIMGKGGFPFEAHLKNNQLSFEGMDGLEGIRWRKQ